jgi:hypothetical protein
MSAACESTVSASLRKSAFSEVFSNQGQLTQECPKSSWFGGSG